MNMNPAFGHSIATPLLAAALIAPASAAIATRASSEISHLSVVLGAGSSLSTWSDRQATGLIIDGFPADTSYGSFQSLAASLDAGGVTTSASVTVGETIAMQARVSNENTLHSPTSHPVISASQLNARILIAPGSSVTVTADYAVASWKDPAFKDDGDMFADADVALRLFEQDKIEESLSSFFCASSNPFTSCPAQGSITLGYLNTTAVPVIASFFGVASVSAGPGNTVSPVPEPPTWALFLAGIGALAMVEKRKRAASVDTPFNPSAINCRSRVRGTPRPAGSARPDVPESSPAFASP